MNKYMEYVKRHMYMFLMIQPIIYIMIQISNNIKTGINVITLGMYVLISMIVEILLIKFIEKI